ncbi:hypothetical protein NM688_g428 [Phlebia brevispora]|uniref:Uncharacterized protein n=1 Tax=Phlebia brevispora TaxID=194682 RepID=A0ACC1TEC3_9APHY|nr:hypothetical protein NM688_g428 [Phlebia brevispora]
MGLEPDTAPPSIAMRIDIQQARESSQLTRRDEDVCESPTSKATLSAFVSLVRSSISRTLAPFPSDSDPEENPSGLSRSRDVVCTSLRSPRDPNL